MTYMSQNVEHVTDQMFLERTETRTLAVVLSFGCYSIDNRTTMWTSTVTTEAKL